MSKNTHTLENLLLAFVKDTSLIQTAAEEGLKLNGNEFNDDFQNDLFKLTKQCYERKIYTVTPEIIEREGLNLSLFNEFATNYSNQDVIANFKGNLLEVKGYNYIKQVINNVKQINDLLSQTKNTKNYFTTASQLEENIKTLTNEVNEATLQEASKWKTSDAIIKNDYKYTENAELIKSGISDIDMVIGGFARKNVSVIDGLSSHGKTTLLIQIIANMIAEGKKVLFVSIEMTAVDIITKLAALLMDQSFNEWRITNLTKDNAIIKQEKMLEIVDNYIRERLYIIDETDMTLPKLMANLRKAEKESIDVVALDYLQKMKVQDQARELPLIAETVTNFIKTTNMAFIFLAQLTEKEGADPLKARIRYATELFNVCALELRVFRKDPQPRREGKDIIEPSTDDWIAAEKERHIAFIKTRFNSKVKPLTLAFDGEIGRFAAFRSRKINSFEDIEFMDDISMENITNVSEQAKYNTTYGDVEGWEDFSFD